LLARRLSSRADPELEGLTLYHRLNVLGRRRCRWLQIVKFPVSVFFLRDRQQSASKKEGTMRIGVLTGGGDCPGLNAAIRAIVRRAYTDEVEVVGFRNGWLGLVENDVMRLDRNSVTGILPRGGTILGTSRYNPLTDPKRIDDLKKNWRSHELAGLIVVGGEGSLA